MTRQMVAYKRRLTRTALLDHARDLARSGEHADAEAVFTAMQGAGEFNDAPRWFDDWAFRHQLNHFCTLARDGQIRRKRGRGTR